MEKEQLNKIWDKTRIKVFLDKNAVFLGHILCKLKFNWDENIPTALVTDKLEFKINPNWFVSLPEDTRTTIIIHELWHIGRLHSLRLSKQYEENRQYANMAADYEINISLMDEGYSFKGIERGCIDEQYRGIPAEDIFEMLKQSAQQKKEDNESNQQQDDQGSFSNNPNNNTQGDNKSNKPDLDYEPTKGGDNKKLVSIVQQAINEAKKQGYTLDSSINAEGILKDFTTAKVPWYILLRQFFLDILEKDYSWKRPNKRYEDIYLPSLRDLNEGRLEHLMYFLDVSGSISEEEITQFNSEVKYIKETFNPQKLTVVQFDTEILDVKEYTEQDRFEEVNIIYGGGTDYCAVREMIISHNPTAAIIFTDLCATPMEPIKNIPIFWICSTEYKASFGKTINIKI